MPSATEQAPAATAGAFDLDLDQLQEPAMTYALLPPISFRRPEVASQTEPAVLVNQIPCASPSACSGTKAEFVDDVAITVELPGAASKTTFQDPLAPSGASHTTGAP